MHVMACMQLAGEAAGMQIPGAALAGVFNMGGAAVANRQHPGARQMSGPAAHMPEGGVAPVSRRVMNLAHFLVQAARRHPERHALICGEATLSWRELDGHQRGAGPGVGRPWRGQGRPRAGAFAQQL